MRPFVVSGDIEWLLTRWAAERSRQLPGQSFFEGLRERFVEYLRTIFPDVVFLPERDLFPPLEDLTARSPFPVVAIDPVSHRGSRRLEICRLVDAAGRSCGLGSRLETSLIRQVRQLKTQGLREIALVDDVLFTGEQMIRIIHALRGRDINVRQVYAAIGIESAIRRLSQTTPVFCVRSFPAVIDQVCERDFYPGIPYSGRTVRGHANAGLPYLRPFGNPDWASIPPRHHPAYSQFCLGQAEKLFAAIEQVSGPVRCQDLRGIGPWPRDFTNVREVLDNAACALERAR